MPYIKQKVRDQLSAVPMPLNPGELNYMISTMLLTYMENCGWNYQSINDIMGALEGAKMEFYRRVAAPYEDKKIEENGDVYPTGRLL